MISNWKPPTWKGLVGLASMLSGLITAITTSGATIPKAIDGVLVTVGAALLAFERISDAMDYRTDNPPPVAGAVAPAPPSAPLAGGLTSPLTVTMTLTPGAPVTEPATAVPADTLGGAATSASAA